MPARRAEARTTRRALLGAGLAGTAAVAGCDAEGTGESAPTTGATTTPPADPFESELVVPDFDPDDWDSVRAQFPLTTDRSHFSAFALSSHTAQVDAAVDFHRRRLGADTHRTLNEAFGLEDEVRAAAVAVVGGRPDQVAFTDSTTMGIATMYGGLDLRPGDEVLTTTHDFFATEDALRLLTRRTGAQVRRVTLYDDPAEARVDTLVERLLVGVTPRTRVVAVTWVHSSTGVRLPIAEIARGLADLGGRALLCVDGVHGFAAVDSDLDALGCDVLATGTHKWLFGPRGTGILWARDWAPLTEIIPSFDGPGPGDRLTAGGYQAFEHRWAMREAFDFYARVGRARAVERTVEQATRLKEGLAELDRIRVVTPLDPEVSAGIVCVDRPGFEPYDTVLQLEERGISAGASPYRRSYLRFGPSIVTSPDEVDAVVEAMTELV